MCSSLYSNLPPEILIKIFHYLDFYDIQAVRLCCKQWFAITRLPEFDSKAVFKITSGLLDNSHPAAEVILNKQITKLYLKSVQFGDVDKLFRHLGASVKALTLKLVPIVAALRLTSEYFPSLHTLKVCQITLSTLVEDVEYLSHGSLPQLRELELNANDSSVNKCLLTCLLYTQTLERLTVKFTKKDEPEVLRVLERHSKSLNRLDLRYYEGRPLEPQWIGVLGGMNLSELCLHGSFSLEILKSAIEAQKSLRSLDVTGSVAVDDDYLALIVKQLLVLERLILAYCGRITDEGIKGLAKLSQLKALDITCCHQITSVGVHEYINGLSPSNPNLVELHLQEINIDPGVICLCANNLPNLRVFNLGGCGNALTNLTLQEIFECQGLLRDLRLDNCNGLCDAGMLGLSTGASIQYLKYLQRLSLRGCKRLSDVTLKSGLKLPQLKFLDIAYCDAITNEGLESLVQNCPTLEEICISLNKGVNPEITSKLIDGLGRLRVLTITNCKDLGVLGGNNWIQCKYRKVTNEVTLKRYSRSC